MNAPAYTPPDFDANMADQVGKPASSDIKRRLAQLKSGFLTGMYRGDHFRALIDNIAKDNQRLNRWRFPALLLRIVLSLLAYGALLFVIRDGWNWFLQPVLNSGRFSLATAFAAIIVARSCARPVFNREVMLKNEAETKRVKDTPWLDLTREKLQISVLSLVGLGFIWSLLWFVSTR